MSIELKLSDLFLIINPSCLVYLEWSNLILFTELSSNICAVSLDRENQHVIVY